MIHIVKSFILVNEAEVDAFLELHYFLYDPPNVDNLISSLEDDPSIFEGVQYAPQ